MSQCEDGQRQSPIDIFTTKTQYDASKVDVKFDLERKKINESVTFENDGETGWKNCLYDSENICQEINNFNIENEKCVIKVLFE